MEDPNFKIHPALKKYHKFAGKTECGLSVFTCGNWVACGPRNSCLYTRGTYIPMTQIPCKLCGFWAGYGMKDWEIENAVALLAVITGATHEKP